MRFLILACTILLLISSLLKADNLDSVGFASPVLDLPEVEENFYQANRISGVYYEEGKFSWVGRVLGSREGFVSYGRVGDTITLTVSFADGESYTYRGKVENFNWTKEIKSHKSCGGCVMDEDLPQDPRARAQPSYSLLDGDANLVDLMVVYPAAVREEAGSTSAIQSEIMKAVADANLCYRNSQVNLLIRLVHMEEVAYTPTGLLGTDLDRLKNTSDGYMDSIHSARDQYGADLVALLSTESDSGGLASTMSYPSLSFESSGFNVNVWDQIAAPNYTLAHEIGHNMGCLHNVEDASNVSENYVFSAFCYGKRWTSNGQGYRTVMSYDSNPSSYPNKVPYFSNPEVTYMDIPTGDITANNAMVLSSTSPYVSNFRRSVVQGIVATNYDLIVLEGNFSGNFRVRLAAEPTNSTEVQISISGDEDLLLGSSSTLTFDQSNWNLQQTVQVIARADSDSNSNTGTLILTSTGIPSASVNLTEYDSGTAVSTKRYVSGVVSNALGVAMEGVAIELSNNGGSTTTNSSGSFVLKVDQGWSGTVTPSKENYTFSPDLLDITATTGDSLGNGFEGNRSNILYVNSSATGSGDGSSWSDAYTDLGDALRATVPYDEVWVAQGTYVPGLVRSSHFLIPVGKEVYGGFAGTEIDRAQRNYTNNPTILSGDIGISNDTTDNVFHVVIPSNESVLDGFTISDGNANLNFSNDDRGKGAGLWADSSAFTVSNCIFNTNLAYQGGAGIYLKDANATFVSCVFIDNDAGSSGSGGAAYLEDSNVSFQSSLFQTNDSGYQGGAIRWDNSTGSMIDSNFTSNRNTASNGAGCLYLLNSSPSILRCRFTNNLTLANSYGGAIKFQNSNASITESFFIGNQSQANSAGAIYLDADSNATFSQNHFELNSAAQFGGAIFADDSDLILNGGTFLGNYANYGGGIATQGSVSCSFSNIRILGNESNSSASSSGGFAYFNTGSTGSTFVNCVISRNKSNGRGGVYRPKGATRFVNCSIVGNQAGTEGGVAILFSGDSIALANSIMWGNTATTGNEIFVNSGDASANYSLFNPSQSSGIISGSNNLNTDPLFTDADGADNIAGTEDDDLSLQSGSPAIDAASSSVANYPSTDLAGIARSGAPDVGAYEFYVNSLPTISTGNSISIAENSISVVQVSASDSDGDSLSYSITGGADQSLFTINSSTGLLSFITAVDYENPSDSGGDNVYELQVAVSDGTGSSSLTFQVTVSDVYEAPASTDSDANFTVSGGQFGAPYFNFADGAGQTPDFTTEPLYRGATYQFSDSGVSGSHPFMIGESYGDTTSSLVSGGPLNGSGGIITVSIPSDFNGSLYYYCTNHGAMIQEFNIRQPNHTADLNASVALEMIWVEPGSFTMGSPTRK